MNGSTMTKVPGVRSSRSEPTALIDRMSATPRLLSAAMFARFRRIGVIFFRYLGCKKGLQIVRSRGHWKTHGVETGEVLVASAAAVLGYFE